MSDIAPDADPRPPVLITRPAAAADRFARALRLRFGADWPVVISPLVAARPTGAEIPAADAFIFTSEQAVAAAPPRPGLRAWCVGPRTAEAARAHGFDAVAGPGDAAGLWRLLVAEAPEGRLVHLRGAEVATPLAEMLRDAGLDVAEVVVYRQEPLPLTAEAQALLARPVVVLAPVFSPRSARLLTEAATGARARFMVAALSPAVAAAAMGLIPAAMETAAHPDAASALDALARLIGARLDAATAG